MKIQRLLLILTVLFGCLAVTPAQQSKPSQDPETLPPSASNSPQTWKEYSSLKGRFKALFPGTRNEFDFPFELRTGNVKFHLVIFNTVISYQVGYVDYAIDIENVSRRMFAN